MTEPSMGRSGSQDVDRLAEVANYEHARVAASLRSGLAHALAAGAALNEAKKQFSDRADGTLGGGGLYVVGEGFRLSWRQWMEKNLTFHATTANLYMRVDKFRDELAEAEVDSFKGAIRFMRKHQLRLRQELTDDDVALIYELLDAGVPKTEVAARFDTSKQNVHYHDVKRRRPASPPRRPRVQIDDDMIERAASFLVSRFADAGYFVRVCDQVRHDALELLQVALGQESASEEAA